MRSTLAKLALILGIVGPLTVCGTAAGEAAGNRSLTGVWLTASGNLEVGVESCGAALCGKVVRVAANRAMDQAGGNDSANSVIGLMILKDFTPSSDNEWDGEIYNRENGKTYSCRIELAADDTLKVHPYKFLPLFGQTQIWHRVSETAKP
jgi:uncharacterized protein (DUF2147 family)